MPDLYLGREQTRAKHFILKSYLQELAFKVLNSYDLTYVDGFSGPWEERGDDYKDTSFKIAINALKDAQAIIRKNTGQLRSIKCFFSEKDPDAYAKLRPVVEAYHDPAGRFEVQTYCGKFEDAVPVIQRFIGTSFPLIFIDPTGWTGFSLDRIQPLFLRPKCEVLINYMYDHINRFVFTDDPEIVVSFDGILGGPGWRDRLDPSLHRGLAAELLFRSTLRDVGRFDFVVSTKIDKATADRPHFFLAYGTKDRRGLIAFRDVEYKALKEHERARQSAKDRQKEERTGQGSLFSAAMCQPLDSTVDALVAEQMALARIRLQDILVAGPIPFTSLVPKLLQPFMIRKTNVKDLCVDLASKGKIENTWGRPPNKPDDGDVIRPIVAGEGSRAA